MATAHHFYHPQPTSPQPKTKKYTFDFPISGRTIQIRLDVEACREQIGDNIDEYLDRILTALDCSIKKQLV